jgi:hypothetical protein
MPIYNDIYKATVTNGGGTINLDVTQSTVSRYVFSGTATLAAGYVIQPTGTPLEGMEFKIFWQAVVTTAGANTVTVFGTVLTTAQALKDLIITCYYNGSAWDVDINEDGSSVLWENGSGGNTTAKLINGGTSTASATGAVSAGQNNTCSGQYSFSAGRNNIASQITSTALGSGNTTSGANGFTVGSGCTASGSNSAAVGALNTASGVDSFSTGNSCVSSGDDDFSCGSTNTASGGNSFASGSNTKASANSAFSGGLNTIANRYAQFSRASGVLGTNGVDYNQYSLITLHATTEDATPEELKIDGISANLTIPANSGGFFEGKVFAIQQSGAAGTVGDCASWNFNGTIKNIAGTTVLVDTVLYQDTTGAWGASARRSDDAAAAWTIAVTADNANDCLDITVTGQANKTIYWQCFITFTEIKYTP